MQPFSVDFKRFFLRGLAAVLPTILTILLFSWLYNTIGKPINSGSKYMICKVMWEYAEKGDIPERFPLHFKQYGGEKINNAARELYYFENTEPTASVCTFWNQYLFLFGFILAIIAIYIIGRFLTSYLGRIGLKTVEKGLSGIPIVNQVYTSIKQVTDFLISDDRKKGYSRVVAVEYPRKGIWSLGLATNTAMKTFTEHIEGEMMTVFVPSSPTPITGYTITVKREDVIDLPLSIDEALKFTISGGVVIPAEQQLAKLNLNDNNSENEKGHEDE